MGKRFARKSLSLFFKKGTDVIIPLNIPWANYVFNFVGIESKKSSFSVLLRMLLLEEYYKAVLILSLICFGRFD